MLPLSSLALVLGLTSLGSYHPAFAWKGTQTDTAIARIRREYAAVNAMLPRCSRRVQDLFGQSTEGGTLEVYRCGGEIRKMVATYYGETGQARSEWYLTGERPFFQFRLDLRYARPFGPVAGRSEERLYLRDGRIIRWIGHDRDRSEPADARERTDEAAREIADLLDRARTGRVDES